MRLKVSLLLLAVAAIAACGTQRDEPGTGPPADEAAPAPASPPPADSPGALPAAGVAPAAGQAIGSLRVDAPGEGAITFDGFGPAAFGASAEAVRQAWGGDLGDAQPDEQGGCHYLIPQPLGPEGYRTAFMIEGNRFVRVDVRDAGVTAPGGAKVGMSGDEVRALYSGRVEERPHKYDPEGKVLRVAAPGGAAGALVLELDPAGRVDEWRVGVPPQVDYVEGCS